MTFLYPAASSSIIKGNSFYRIKAQAVEVVGGGITTLGPGSLIPIDVGFSALAVGPDSDYDRYELLYPDKTAPGGVQRIPFSTERPIVGAISADNTSVYPDSGDEVAKAFVRILDFGSVPTNRLRLNEGDKTDPVIAECQADIVVYTGVVPTDIPEKRTPKRRSANVGIFGFNTSFLIPGYGRRHITFWADRRSSGATLVNVTARGWHLGSWLNADTDDFTEGLSGRAIGASSIAERTLVNENPMTDSQFHYHHNAEIDGFYDFYELILNNAGGTPTDEPSFPQSQFYVALEARD